MAAIDPKKLLNAGGDGNIVKAEPKMFLVPTSYTRRVDTVDLSKPDNEENVDEETSSVIEDIKVIRKSVVKIETILKKSIKLNTKKLEISRKNLERKKRENQESKLEKKKEKKEKFGGIPLPKIGFFDKIKNFIGSILLGWLALQLVDHLPKLKPLLKSLGFVHDFLNDFIFGISEKLISFIEIGYDVVKKVEDTTESIFGKEAKKKFKEFESNFTKFMNLALIVGMSTMGGVDPFEGKGKFNGPQRVGFDRSGRRVSTRAQQRYLGRYGDKKFAQRFGNKNLNRLDKLARKATGIDGRVGGKAVDPLAGMMQRGVTKVAGKRAGAIAGKVPLVGPLIDFGIRTLIFKEPLGKAAAGAVGAGVGQALGTWIGGAIGGVAGSVVPIVGNLIGASAGAAIGGILGGLIGDQLGVSLYNVISGSAGKGTPIEKKEDGGKVGSNAERRERERKMAQRAARGQIDTFNPPQAKPGKNSGQGFLQKIWGGIVNQRDLFREKIDIVLKTSKSLKKRNNSIISKIMGLGVDLLLGQVPDSSSASKIAKHLIGFFDLAMPAPAYAMQRLLAKFEGGGQIEFNEKLESEKRKKELTRKIASSIKSASVAQSKDSLNVAKRSFLSPLFGVVRGIRNIFGGGAAPAVADPKVIADAKAFRAAYPLPKGTPTSSINPYEWQMRENEMLHQAGIGNDPKIDWVHMPGSHHYNNTAIDIPVNSRANADKVMNWWKSKGYGVLDEYESGGHIHVYWDKAPASRPGATPPPRGAISPTAVTPTGKATTQGEISWYGPGFIGNRTASGEVFTGKEMTAAHKTLPFGTLIRITWKGKSIVVRVNDRGPFIPGRVLDLSPAAADALGMKGSGVANGAKIEIVEQKKASTPARIGPNARASLDTLNTLKTAAAYEKNSTVIAVIEKEVPVPIG